MVSGSPFYEIAVILGLAAALGAVGQKLRQPLIIMFLATGILAGPAGLGVIRSYGEIELLAHIGIALLLFIVGLSLHQRGLCGRGAHLLEHHHHRQAALG